MHIPHYRANCSPEPILLEEINFVPFVSFVVRRFVF